MAKTFENFISNYNNMDFFNKVSNHSLPCMPIPNLRNFASKVSIKISSLHSFLMPIFTNDLNINPEYYRLLLNNIRNSIRNLMKRVAKAQDSLPKSHLPQKYDWYLFPAIPINRELPPKTSRIRVSFRKIPEMLTAREPNGSWRIEESSRTMNCITFPENDTWQSPFRCPIEPSLARAWKSIMEAEFLKAVDLGNPIDQCKTRDPRCQETPHDPTLCNQEDQSIKNSSMEDSRTDELDDSHDPPYLHDLEVQPNSPDLDDSNEHHPHDLDNNSDPNVDLCYLQHSSSTQHGNLERIACQNVNEPTDLLEESSNSNMCAESNGLWCAKMRIYQGKPKSW